MADENLGTLRYDIELDTKGLQRGAKKAESIMNRLQKHFQFLGEINQAGELLTRTGRAVFDFGKQFIDASAQVERLTAGLTSITGSADEAERQLKRLREVAKLPGLGFVEAVEGSTNLQAAGFSAEKAEESLRAFGNALASVGKGKAELDGVILALSQMQAKGKLSAEEINQIAERVPQIRQVMIDAFGTAIPKEIEKMGISIDDFVSGVNRSLLKIPPVAETASNAFENLGDVFNQLLANVGDQALPIVAGATRDLSDAISGLNESFLPTADRVGNVATRLEELNSGYTAQNESTQTLITRYGEIQEALSDANIDTAEAERLNAELLELVKNLKEQLPALIGLWGEEGGAIDQANGALQRRINLQKEIVRNEALKAIRDSEKALGKENRQIERSQKFIDNLRKSLTAFSQEKGVGKLGDLTFSELNNPAARRLLEDQFSNMSDIFGGNLIDDTLLSQLSKAGEGATLSDVVGGLIGKEENRIKEAEGNLAGISVQLERLVEASGDAEVQRFEQLISTFGETQNERQFAAWNNQLEILAKNLNLDTGFLKQFIAKAKEASGLERITPTEPTPKAKSQAQTDKEREAQRAEFNKGKKRLGGGTEQEILTARLELGKKERELEAKLAQQIASNKIKEAEETKQELAKIQADRIKEEERQQKRLAEFDQAQKDRQMEVIQQANQLERHAEEETKRVAKESEAEVTEYLRQQAEERAAILAPSPVSAAFQGGTSSMTPMVDAATAAGAAGGPGLMAMAVDNVIENAVMYVNAVADITDATAEWAEITGRKGLAKALDATTMGLDLLTTFMTQGPVMAAFQGLGMVISHFTEKARKEAEKQRRIADELARQRREIWQEGNRLGFALIDSLVDAAKSGRIDDFGQILEQQINDQILGAILGQTVYGNTYQDAFQELNAILSKNGQLTGSARVGAVIEPLEELRARFDRLIEAEAANAKSAMKALGIVPKSVEKEEAQVAKGLSVAIRNITTRQADTLTRVLRGQLSLMSQIQSNTLRSATALETYLPTLETLNLSAPSTSNGSNFGAKASNILALETARTFAAAGI